MKEIVPGNSRQTEEFQRRPVSLAQSTATTSYINERHNALEKPQVKRQHQRYHHPERPTGDRAASGYPK